MSQKKPPFSPFKEIALCLSGGGYRATSFHLGAMSYLNNISLDKGSLLHSVKAISTVSGGTFTGILYALMSQEGMTFDAIYENIMSSLYNNDLVAESLKKLKKEAKWDNKNKSVNPINAFSETYNALLTKGATFSDLTSNKNSHLDLIAFNSTDFTSGINFRFQAEWKNGDQNRNLKRGNNAINLNFDTQNEIKLSDIIAASSCFPGGFEPIRFPHDFVYDGAENLKLLIEDGHFSEPIGLMDGGIYDNQGIDSIQLSEVRRASLYNKSNPENNLERYPYDLIIISDVSSPDIENPFQFHETPNRSFSGFSYNGLMFLGRKIMRLVIILALVLGAGGLLLMAATGFKDTIATGVGISIMLLALILIVIAIVSSKKIRSLRNDVIDMVKGLLGPFYLKQISRLDIKDYTIRDLEPLVINRVSSVILMAMDIFLKQVRRLKYNQIYNDNLYTNRKISNLIKELTEKDWKKSREFQQFPNLDPSLMGDYSEAIGGNLKSVCEEAASFGTTLWFTPEDKDQDKLDKLVASGQATMCFNIIDYIIKLKMSAGYGSLSAAEHALVEKVLNQCINDWKSFKKNPLFLIQKKAA